MDLCHYHWRWFQPKNWVMIWFCFANHLIWGSRWHFSWTRRKSIRQVEIFRLIELDTSIQLSLSNPCFPPARFMIRNTFFSCEFGPKYHTLIKIFVHPVGRPTIFFDAAGGSSPLLMVWSVSVHHEMFFFPRECSVHHEMTARRRLLCSCVRAKTDARNLHREGCDLLHDKLLCLVFLGVVWNGEG